MMRDILHGYELRTGVKPKRVVVHKTSMYQPEEEEGFREGTKGIVPNCDLVWLRQTPFRMVRKGTEEPWRGTSLPDRRRFLSVHERIRALVGRIPGSSHSRADFKSGRQDRRTSKHDRGKYSRCPR